MYLSGTIVYVGVHCFIYALCLQQQAPSDALYYLRTLASSLTIAAFSAVLPPVFEALTQLEKWRTPGLEVRYTLIRYLEVQGQCQRSCADCLH